MENQVGKCFNCRHFFRYYTKGLNKFNKTKLGWCAKTQSTVDTQCGCEEYVFKPKRKLINKLAKNTLNRLLTEISEVRKLIEEEVSNENEEL